MEVAAASYWWAASGPSTTHSLTVKTATSSRCRSPNLPKVFRLFMDAYLTDSLPQTRITLVTRYFLGGRNKTTKEYICFLGG